MRLLLIRFFHLAICSLVLVGCDDSEEVNDLVKKIEERSKDEAKKFKALSTTVELVKTDGTFKKYYSACPAVHFGKEKSRVGAAIKGVLGDENDVDSDTCLLASEFCYSLCKDGDDAACRGLAGALGDVEDQFGRVPARMSYAMACAAGSASGCTNRGAGMLNYPIPEDPMSNLPDAEKHVCTFSLFETACRNDDSWGCSMLGEAYSLGQGTNRDTEKAKEFFDKTCVLDDEGEYGCSYAKSLMEDLPDAAGSN